jgi:hypothetical protein
VTNAQVAEELNATGEQVAGTVEAVPAIATRCDLTAIRLWRGEDGQLWGEGGATASTERREPRALQVRRLFPWSSPDAYVSLRDADDEELCLVRDPAELDAKSRDALEVSLAEAGFVMEIERIDSIEEEIEIRTFQVMTKQGKRTFQTERDEWPRELAGGGVLLRDVAGDLYAVREPERLDPASRKLLWVFID